MQPTARSLPSATSTTATQHRKETAVKNLLLILNFILPAVAEADTDPIFEGNDWVVVTDTSLTIYSDRGGSISDYQDFIDDNDLSIRILGTCVSSCTMFLGTPDVCVAAGATIGFHGPRSDDLSIAHLTKLVHSIASYYPPALQAPFTQDWGLHRSVTWFLGADLHSMTQIPLCPEQDISQ
jgi:hypothetical protein